MSDFVFLDKEDYVGGYSEVQCSTIDSPSYMRPIRIFRKRKAEAAITDFSILLGGEVDESRRIEEGRIGPYWAGRPLCMDDKMYVLKTGNYRDGTYQIDRRSALSRNVGARPALPLSRLSSIPTNGKKGERAKDGVFEVEYGYYPQDAVSRDMQEKLEEVYRSGNISKTRNSFTTNAVNRMRSKFQPQTHQEYEYNGKRYVRIKANLRDANGYCTLSNDEQYKAGDNVWVEVQPVKWLVDKISGIMITDKIIFAGVPYSENGKYLNGLEFDKTTIKRFMDRYWSKDLVQQRYMNENLLYNLDFSETSEADKRLQEGHSGDEAKGTIASGISAFNKIIGSYKKYLAREKDKEKDKEDDRSK